MIKNIVFDLGNVLIDFDADKILRKYLSSSEDIKLMKKELFGSLEWRETDRGTISLTDAMHAVMKRLPPHLAELTERLKLKQPFERVEMPPFESMPPVVKKLKENGYKLYLLSNAGINFNEYRDNIPALSYFDGEFISSAYHLLKPEREIYLKFFEVFGLNPSECVFIDDIQENIDGAAACGMDGICFSPNKYEVSYLVERLIEKGINIR